MAALLAASPVRAQSAPPVDRCVLEEECPDEGFCTSRGEECVPTSASCRAAKVCEVDGRCGLALRPDGDLECAATDIAMCQQSWECLSDGVCDLDPETQRCDAGAPRARSTRAAGIAYLTAGGGLALIGIVIGVRNYPSSSSPPSDSTNTLGVVAGVVGGVMLGAGLAMTVYGSQRVPRDGAPTVRVGPGQVSMRWSL